MKKILFYDSGVGGFSVFLKTLKYFPYANYVYFQDRKNLPYGNKTEKQIFDIVKNNIENLLKEQNIAIVVFACNTATSVCIDRFRLLFPHIFFVGTEPCIKLASRRGCKNIFVLATQRTLKQQKFLSLVYQANKKGHNVECYPPIELAELVEQAIKKDEWGPLEKCLHSLLPKVASADCVVLGCTHYSLVKHKIREVLKKPVLDGNCGIEKQIETKINMCLNKHCCGNIKFLSS